MVRNEPAGLLAIRKPLGPTSATVVEQIKRWSGVRRIGHAGTLDPAADGVLVLAFGRATGCFFYLPTDKAYRAVLRLGITTDTLDSQGRVVQVRPVPELTWDAVQEQLQPFQGVIQQRPPMVSALHHQGQRLYDLARRGESVEVPLRTVEIRHLGLVEMVLPDLTLEVSCSRGTYIRTLTNDLGERLGCGAHLIALTRTLCSGFTYPVALPWDELATWFQNPAWTGQLVSMNQALQHLPELLVDDAARIAVLHGRRVPAPQMSEGSRVRIIDRHGELLAMAEVIQAEAVMRRVFGEPAATRESGAGA